MKSFRGTFIFTILVIAACVFSYFEVFKKGNDEAEQKEKDSQLYQLMADEITQIDLNNGENLISLKKTGATWSLEKPLVDKADQTAVKSFIDTIVGQKSSDLVEEGEKVDLKTYGLDHPAFRLKLSGIHKDAKNVAANLAEDVTYGAVKAYDGSNYSRFGNEKKIYLAPAYLSAALNKKPSDFRNKNLYTTAISDVDHITINGSQTLELERTKESWKMLKPANFESPVSSDSVQSFLDLVRNVKGTEIVADSKEQLVKYHLDKPAVVLKLHRSEEPKDYELTISDPKKDKDQSVYSMSSDSSGILKGVESNLTTINKVPFDFTDKHQPFTFGTADVGTIQISTTDFKADLKKNGNAWVNADANDKRPVDTLKVDEFLGKFNHLEAKEMLESTSQNLKNEILISDSSAKLLFKMNWQASVDTKSQLEQVITSKNKKVFTLGSNQIQGLNLAGLFKNPDPIQFSGSPPPHKKGPSLDVRPPTQKTK